jgi:hypothetical protein
MKEKTNKNCVVRNCKSLKCGNWERKWPKIGNKLIKYLIKIVKMERAKIVKIFENN